MLDPGRFFVIAIGRRYLRSDDGMVTGQLEHAKRYDGASCAEAIARQRTEAARASGHVVRVQRVTIEDWFP